MLIVDWLSIYLLQTVGLRTGGRDPRGDRVITKRGSTTPLIITVTRGRVETCARLLVIRVCVCRRRAEWRVPRAAPLSHSVGLWGLASPPRGPRRPAVCARVATGARARACGVCDGECVCAVLCVCVRAVV